MPVYTTADHPVTVLTKSLTLKPGQKAYVYHYPITVKVYSWGGHPATKIGLTSAIRCYNQSGKVVVYGHYGANIGPSSSDMLRPVTRVLLDEPNGGTFTCKLEASAYNPGVVSGMKLGVYADPAYTPGMRFSVSTNATTWTTTVAGSVAGYSIAPGKMLTYLTKTVAIPRNANSWVVTEDGQITTCNSSTEYPPLCSHSNFAGYSTVQTWIEIQPVKSDGVTLCGDVIRSSTNQAVITSDRHHQTMLNSYTFTKTMLQNTTLLPTTATKAKIALKVKVIAGNYVIAHDAYNYAHAISLGTGL